MQSINEFLNYIQIEKNYSPRTVKEYKQDLAIFQEFLKADILHAKRADIRNFLSYLKTERNYSTSAVLRKLAVLSSFYKFALREDYISKNQVDFIEPPKIEKTLPVFLTNEEVDKLLNLAGALSFTLRGKRNYAIVFLILSTGLRISELTALKLKNIETNFDDLNIKIKGKGNKERILPVMGKAKQAFQSWLRERPSSHVDNVFINTTTLEAITSRAIQKMIKQLSQKAGINKKITPHKLRHTFATNLLRNEANIVSIQTLLGHESLNTTRIYTHVTTEDTKKAVMKLSFI